MAERCLSIVSWNVLADAYMFKDRYPFSPSSIFDSVLRQKLVVEHIKTFEADVVCLQEVDRFLVEALQASGLFVLWVSKEWGKPDGCAMIIKDPSMVEDHQRFEYKDGTGHVAQIVSLMTEAGSLMVANTHLRWAPDASDPKHVGVMQARVLVSLLADYRRVVIAGDINSSFLEGPRTLFREASYKEAHPPSPTAFIADTGEQSLDVIAAKGLEVVGTPIPPVYQQMPDLTMPSDHVPLAADVCWLP